MRILNPMNISLIISSVLKTRRILVIDGGWSSCGISSEIITSVVENLPVNTLLAPPKRITLPSCPAPSSEIHEKEYYPNIERIVSKIRSIFKNY